MENYPKRFDNDSIQKLVCSSKKEKFVLGTQAGIPYYLFSCRLTQISNSQTVRRVFLWRIQPERWNSGTLGGKWLGSEEERYPLQLCDEIKKNRADLNKYNKISTSVVAEI